MKVIMIVLAFTMIGGCAIVPLGSYDAYSPYYSSSYYPSTGNDYYSSGYPVAQYSGYYGYTGYSGYGYGRPSYSGYYGHGYQRPAYSGYSGYGYYGSRNSGSYSYAGRGHSQPPQRRR